MSAMQSAFMLTTAGNLNPLSSANRAMLLDLLADATVDVNAEMSTAGGGTALMQACRSKNVDLARLLLEHGADPNKRSATCEPLASAIAHAPKDVGCQLVALLISHGARPSSTSLQIAALHGRFGALQLLLDAPSVAQISSEDAEVLIRYATASRSVETIDMVNAHLRRGAPTPGQARPALDRLCESEAEEAEAAKEMERRDLHYPPAENYSDVCALAKADDPTVPAFRTKSELVRLILDLQSEIRRLSIAHAV